MLIRADQSLLLVIDIQDRLLPAVCDNDRLVEQTGWLMDVANDLEIPTLISEQYPKGLGHTTDALLTRVDAQQQVISKEAFSCADDTACLAAIRQRQRQQVIVCGMEAHVCVLQTAVGLQQHGFDVFVVADLISSRSISDRDLAIARLRQLNIQLVSREMVAFEWMQRCNTDSFRHISKNYLR